MRKSLSFTTFTTLKSLYRVLRDIDLGLDEMYDLIRWDLLLP